jgi:hypothetical protein
MLRQQSAIKLQQHDPSTVIDLLRGTAKYDLAWTESFDYVYPAYIRGLAVPGTRRWQVGRGSVSEDD